MPTVPILATLDWVLLAVLGLSVAVGLWRGLVYELMSLAAWLVAWWVAQTWHRDLAQQLQAWPASPVLSYALCFVGTLFLCALLARLLRLLVSATPLQLIDRLLGAGFGLLRGLLILLVVATLVALTPLAKAPFWQASQGAAWLSALLHVLQPLWPVGRAA